MGIRARIAKEQAKRNTHLVVRRALYEKPINKAYVDSRFNVVFHIKRGDMNFTVICF
ncbi:hypothetical protein NVP1293O_49 [Vibrio phage 1.293.O._10N.261.52.E1]|nr:hypothetical protein NVP1293O_49 [Vibrio phage 1.293.O._10N.261.52.E1]